MAMVGVFVNT